MIGEFIKAVGCIILAVIFCTVLARQETHIALCLSIAGCCIVFLSALGNLSPVIDFFYDLQAVSGFESGMLSVVLKAVGIALLTEIATTICSDTGNAALGKVLQFLSVSVIICICIPLLNELLKLIESILGKV